jgi:hypothetical protein
MSGLAILSLGGLMDTKLDRCRMLSTRDLKEYSNFYVTLHFLRFGGNSVRHVYYIIPRSATIRLNSVELLKNKLPRFEVKDFWKERV